MSAAQKPAEPKGPRSTGVAKGRSRNLADGAGKRQARWTDGGAAKRINPHPFRSCLATSTAIYHGAEIGLAMTVLEHTSSAVFERYYNQAKMIDAVKAYQEILLANPQG